MDINAPLTPDELRQLDELMEIQGGMRLPKLHGYLTAVISGPEFLHPDSWLPWVWRGREDVLRHPRISNSMDGVCRLYNTIRKQLKEEKPMYPLLVYDQTFFQEVLVNDPALVQWCIGYMEGVDFTDDIWRSSEHQEALTLLAPIILGSEDKEFIEDYLGSLAKEGAFDKVRATGLKNLPGIITKIDDYWTRATNRQRYTIKIAGHRLCPCGSGQKFENCCGRTLH